MRLAQSKREVESTATLHLHALSQAFPTLTMTFVVVAYPQFIASNFIALLSPTLDRGLLSDESDPTERGWLLLDSGLLFTLL